MPFIFTLYVLYWMVARFNKKRLISRLLQYSRHREMSGLNDGKEIHESKSSIFIYAFYQPSLSPKFNHHSCVAQAKNLRVMLDSFLFLTPQIQSCQLYPVNEPQFQPHLSLSTCTTSTLTKPYALSPGPLRQSLN